MIELFLSGNGGNSLFMKTTIFKLVLASIVIFILAVIVNYLPKNPVHKKPPTDYFRVVLIFLM